MGRKKKRSDRGQIAESFFIHRHGCVSQHHHRSAWKHLQPSVWCTFARISSEHDSIIKAWFWATQRVPKPLIPKSPTQRSFTVPSEDPGWHAAIPDGSGHTSPLRRPQRCRLPYRGNLVKSQHRSRSSAGGELLFITCTGRCESLNISATWGSVLLIVSLQSRNSPWEKHNTDINRFCFFCISKNSWEERAFVECSVEVLHLSKYHKSASSTDILHTSGMMGTFCDENWEPRREGREHGPAPILAISDLRFQTRHWEQLMAFISGQKCAYWHGMNAFHQLYISLMQNVTQHVNIWPLCTLVLSDALSHTHTRAHTHARTHRNTHTLTHTHYLCLAFFFLHPSSDFRNFPWGMFKY